MLTLVFGGTGKVGSVAVRRLLEKGQTFRVFSHSPDTIAAHPLGVETVLGDLDNPESISSALND